MQPSDTKAFSKVLKNLEVIEKEISHRDQRVAERSGRTNLVMQMLFAFLGCLALANIYFVNELTYEVKLLITSMKEMYEHFGRVSERMVDMAHYMDRMKNNIRTIPIMTQQMEDMNAYMTHMDKNMEDMVYYITDMNDRIVVMNADIDQMAKRFSRLNNSVGNIGYEVHQMAKPVP